MGYTVNGYRNVKNRFVNWCHTADEELESGDRDVIIEWLWRTNLIPYYVTYLLQRGLEDEYVQDVIGEIWLIICEIKQEKWDMLYEQGKMCISAYITGLIHQQVISTNSKVYQKLGRYENTQFTKGEEWWNNYYYGENNEGENRNNAWDDEGQQ